MGTLLKIPIIEFNQLFENFENVKEMDLSNENKENIKNNVMSVIVKDENQNLYSLICKKSDKFSSLEK